MKKMKQLLTLSAILFSLASHATIPAAPADTIPVTDFVTLNGSSSTDKDGTITKYQWVQTSGTATTLTNPSTAIATAKFTVAGVYTYSLTVTDNENASATKSVTITVLDANLPPVADIKVSSATIKLPVKQ